MKLIQTKHQTYLENIKKEWFEKPCNNYYYYHYYYYFGKNKVSKSFPIMY